MKRTESMGSNSHQKKKTCQAERRYCKGMCKKVMQKGNVIMKRSLKVHKRENFLGSDIEICTFS